MDAATELVAGSSRSSTSPGREIIQTSSAPADMAVGVARSGMAPTITLLVVGSIREIVLVPALATQRASGPTAIADGYVPLPVAMEASTSPVWASRRRTTSAMSSVIQAEWKP